MKDTCSGRIALLGALLLVMGALAGCSSQAPEWQLRDLNGKLVQSSAFNGKVIILDFWATWCPPCREEIPGFISLQDKYGKDGLEVIGVALDKEGVAVVKPFSERMKINYTLLIGEQEMVNGFGEIEAIPTTFIIDRKGKVVSKHVGFTPASVFEREIKPLLAAQIDAP